MVLPGRFERSNFKIFDLVDLYTSQLTLKFFCWMKVYGNYCLYNSKNVQKMFFPSKWHLLHQKQSPGGGL